MERSLPPQYDEMIGRTLLDRYQIVRRLAAGGMGVVYLARALGAAGFAKPVVIKRILPGLAANREFAGMFIREAQILSHLHHPGIVDVVDFAEDEGAYIMVLEYVHGFQLGQWHRYLRSTGKQIPSSIVIQVTINTLDALHHAHSLKRPDGEWMQIIHRDISPSNILIGIDGRSKLVDFGIARMSGTDQGYKTQSKSFKGKLSYSAPEIFQGGQASVKSDVYSCGVVIHEILIGVNDFRGMDYPETFGRVLNHLPVSVHGFREDVPDEIDAVIGKALAKSPKERYQSAAEFAAALRELHVEDERKTTESIASLAHRDFTPEMAAYLEVESLDQLDSAWRNPSIAPQRINKRVDDTAPKIELERDDGTKDAAVTNRSATSGATLEEDSEEHATTVLVRMMSVFPKKHWNRWIIGTAAVVLLLAVGATVAMTTREEKKEERQFLLVQSPIGTDSPAVKPASSRPNPAAAKEDRSDQVEKKSDKANGERDESQNEVGQERVEKLKSRDSAKPIKRAVRKSEGPDVRALTRAFRKRQRQIHDCVERHAVELQGKPKVSIQFRIHPSGKVDSAEISPPALSKTALGNCILSVARSTPFPSQKEQISFHIPVTVWRGPKGE